MARTSQLAAVVFLALSWCIAALPSQIPIENETTLSKIIVLTNDDGWAVAQIRSEYAMLKAAGYKVVLSAPADDKSGTGSLSAPAVPRIFPCQYNSCPAFSPAISSEKGDASINYVNAFPVDAVRYGIQTLAPQRLGGTPDIVFSGVNVGSNLGHVVNISGTIGAAAEAARRGFPSVAFSGVSNAHVSYTTLVTDPSSVASIAAGIYSFLSLKFLRVLLSNDTPLMPQYASINVNFPATAECSVARIQWIFTRLLPDRNAKDIHICGSTSLPDEASVFRLGCYATVSVFDARNKGDVAAEIQDAVYQKIKAILACLPSQSF